jgi:hypothetical protein
LVFPHVNSAFLTDENSICTALSPNIRRADNCEHLFNDFSFIIALMAQAITKVAHEALRPDRM